MISDVRSKTSFTMTRHKSGFTLVELMVAMTVGLFLTGGIIFLFLGNNQAFRSSEAVGVVQENGRYAIEYLTNELRQSGVLGCQRTLLLQKDNEKTVDEQERLTDINGLTIQNLLKIGPGCSSSNCAYSKNVMDWLFNYNLQPQLEGFDGTGSDFETTSQESSLINALTGSNGILEEAIRDHDIIITRRVSGRAIPIKKHTNSYDDIIVFGINAPYVNKSGVSATVNRGGLLQENDIVIASTCEYASIFQVTESEGDSCCLDNPSNHENTIKHEKEKTDQSPGNFNTTAISEAGEPNDLLKTFANPNPITTPEDSIGSIYKLKTTIFYIKKNEESEEGVPALYAHTNLSNQPEEIIRGIYGMQVLYGTNSKAESCDSTGNNPDISTYQPASEIENWNEVNAIKIWLLAGSPEENHENIVDEPMKLPFPATDPDSGAEEQFDASATSSTITSKDQRRFFQVFTTTIYLRNKLPCLGLDQWTEPTSP